MQRLTAGWLPIPERRITVYDITAIFEKAFLRSATPNKAVAGFRIGQTMHISSPMCTTYYHFVASAVTDEDALPPTADRRIIDNCSADCRIINNLVADRRIIDSLATDSWVTNCLASDSRIIHNLAADRRIIDSLAVNCWVIDSLLADRPVGQDLLEELSPKPKLSRPRLRSHVAESASALISFPYKSKLVYRESVKGRAKPNGKSLWANNKSKESAGFHYNAWLVGLVGGSFVTWPRQLMHLLNIVDA